ARAKHKAQMEAQSEGRRRMREDLEEREEAAKRAKVSGEEERVKEVRQREEEQQAIEELKKELDRLRRTGRLDGITPSPSTTTTPPSNPNPKPPFACSASTNPPTRLSLRWGEEGRWDKPSLLSLLISLGVPHEATLAMLGKRAVLELPRGERTAKLLTSLPSSLASHGVSLTISGGQRGGRGANPSSAAGEGSDAFNPDSTKANLGGPTLPEGWREVSTAEGRVYYYHKQSRQTQWSRPEGKGPTAGSDLDATESLTLTRLRQAAERQRLSKEMEAVDEKQGE
ncbi:MAG: hypothetical protein SGPRY_014730, partial [Prymnesium sp.]